MICSSLNLLFFTFSVFLPQLSLLRKTQFRVAQFRRARSQVLRCEQSIIDPAVPKLLSYSGADLFAHRACEICRAS
jgi:hypothetical protein